MTYWTTIHHIDGREITSTMINFFDRWQWILDTLCEQVGCRECDVDTEEDDDGRDYLTVRGKRVGYLTQSGHNGATS